MITAYDENDKPVQLDLYQIDRIELYVWSITIDQIALFFTCGGATYSCTEDGPEWKVTLDTLSQLYPGFSSSMWALYRKSPMNLERTVVFDRARGVVRHDDVEEKPAIEMEGNQQG